MSDTAELKELLNRLKLRESAADLSEWNIFRNKLCEKVEEHLQNYEMLKQTLDLGYQEMQKMLELFEQKDLLTRAIFDASQDIILTLDGRGQIIEYNRTLGVLLKIDSKSIMGHRFVSIIPDCDFTNDLNCLFSEPNSDKASSILGIPYESTIFDSQGKKLIVLVSINRIQYRETIVYQVYIKDLTFEKMAAQALEESRSQLIMTSKMSALGEMAGGVAHEINTPLAVIQMRTEQLLDCAKDDPLDKATLMRALTAIDKTVKRIAKIVSGLRSFARDGRADPMIRSSIAKIVDDTFGLCKERFSSLDVKLEYISKTDIEIECRPVEITQVLLNLLNNAFDAIQKLPEKWVRIELEQIKSDINIRVMDSGSGIPSAIQTKIMQPFFTTKEIGRGTGLGLSISKGIIESHEGSLRIDTNSTNTCLVISLPIEQRKVLTAS